VYAEVARRSFQRHSSYRMAATAGVFTNTVFGFINVSVLLAVLEQRPGLGGLDTASAATFTFLTQGSLMLVGAFGERELANRVVSGDVVVDLCRPVNFVGFVLAKWAGKVAFAALSRFLPPLLVGSLLLGFRAPARPFTWLAYLACLALASLLGGWFWLLVNLSAFWLTEIRGVVTLCVSLLGIGAGLVLPLQIYPDRLGAVLLLTPFAALIQLPNEVLLERRGVLGVWALQVFWIAVVAALTAVVLQRATRKLVIQGG
jgi:ABC-2 type transport system permease protein